MSARAVFTPEQVKFLTELIDARCQDAMVKLKRQLDKEIVQDMAAMDKKISEVAETAQAAPAANNGQLVAVTSQQLTLSVSNLRKETQALVATAMNKAAQAAYDRTTAELKPVIASVTQMVQYQAQDGHEIVDNYRRAVYKQAEGGGDPSVKMLTSGKSERQVTEQLHKFFDESD